MEMIRNNRIITVLAVYAKIKGYSNTIQFDVNTAIWLADPPGATMVILDNLGRYCDVTNMFIRQRQIQKVPLINCN